MIVRAIPSVEDLVSEHMKLVSMVVRSMRAMPCVKRLGDEALSIGRFALFKAAKGYDLSNGVLFKTYAEVAIRRDITHEAIKHDKALGIRLVNPDARECQAPAARGERTVSAAARRKRRRLQRRLGINEQN